MQGCDQQLFVTLKVQYNKVLRQQIGKLEFCLYNRNSNRYPGIFSLFDNISKVMIKPSYYICFNFLNDN